jgi:hypothetical protein
MKSCFGCADTYVHEVEMRIERGSHRERRFKHNLVGLSPADWHKNCCNHESAPRQIVAQWLAYPRRVDCLQGGPIEGLIFTLIAFRLASFDRGQLQHRQIFWNPPVRSDGALALFSLIDSRSSDITLIWRKPKPEGCHILLAAQRQEVRHARQRIDSNGRH